MAADLGGSGGGRRKGIVAINITPMVDVMLVLLIIMMVSAKFIVAQSLKIELPKSASADEAVTSLVQVTITKEGEYHFNDIAVKDDAELVSHLYAARQEGGEEVNLIVRADTEAMHGNVVHVIDLAKQNGIHKFAINIRRE